MAVALGSVAAAAEARPDLLDGVVTLAWSVVLDHLEGLFLGGSSAVTIWCCAMVRVASTCRSVSLRAGLARADALHRVVRFRCLAERVGPILLEDLATFFECSGRHRVPQVLLSVLLSLSCTGRRALAVLHQPRFIALCEAEERARD